MKVWIRVWMCSLVLGVSNVAVAGPFSPDRHCSDKSLVSNDRPTVIHPTRVGPGTVKEYKSDELYLILVDPLVEFSTRMVDPKNPMSAVKTVMQVERGIAIPVQKRCYVIQQTFYGDLLRYLTLETPLGSVKFDLYWEKNLRSVNEIFDLYAELTEPLANGPKAIRLKDRSKLEWKSWEQGMELVEVHPDTLLIQDPDFQTNMKKDFFTIWTSERETHLVSPKFNGKL